MKSYIQFKRDILKNKDVKKAYEMLGPEFEIISLLVRRRMEKSISQKEFARRIGTKQSAISMFEAGRHNPILDFLQKMARALDINIRISITPRR